MKRKGPNKFTAIVAVMAALPLIGPASAGEPVPFKGQSAGQITTTGFDPVQGIVSTHEVGEGEATHLGRFTVVGDVSVYVFTPTGIAIGNFTFTAANGDKVFAILSAHAGADPLHGEGTITIVSGTGRFQGVTGSFQVLTTFAVDPSTAPVVGFSDLFYNGRMSAPGIH
jgi:hypothetical protein